jgi:phage shock protein A
MTAEHGDWLTELSESEPASAVEVGAALVAVLDSPNPSTLACVGSPSTPPSPDPRETADYTCGLMLEELQKVRRRVSEVASSRKRLDLRLGKERAEGAGRAQLAELESDRAAARQREEHLTEQSQRLQWQIDSFRTAKEFAKGMYTAAEAQLRIAELIDATGAERDAFLAQLTAALISAKERLEQVTAQGSQTLDLIREQRRQADAVRTEAPVGERLGVPRPLPPEPPRAPPPPQPEPPEGPLAADPAPGLLELGVDAGGSEIRILFAVAPANTVTLLAVLDGPEALSEHGAEAISVASDLLTEIREEGWPADVDEVTLEDSGVFLARFFPADDGSIRRRSAVLAEATATS